MASYKLATRNVPVLKITFPPALLLFLLSHAGPVLEASCFIWMVYLSLRVMSLPP